KNGKLRFCVDFRKLNNVTKKDTYPLSRIDDMLNNLGNAQWFISLDLTSGYWQVKVKEEDKEKTAFITKYGLYKFNAMPFGLCNAPSTF
ncbi:15956_t:CDS:1, partial [Dentiscutata heterogama]